jgi:hypothetical protein
MQGGFVRGVLVPFALHAWFADSMFMILKDLCHLHNLLRCYISNAGASQAGASF